MILNPPCTSHTKFIKPKQEHQMNTNLNFGLAAGTTGSWLERFISAKASFVDISGVFSDESFCESPHSSEKNAKSLTKIRRTPDIFINLKSLFGIYFFCPNFLGSQMVQQHLQLIWVNQLSLLTQRNKETNKNARSKLQTSYALVTFLY